MEIAESMLMDNRINRCKKHKLESIVLIVICATFKGVQGYQNIAEFAKKYANILGRRIDLSQGCPSMITLWRNFERIDISELIAYIDLNKDFLNVFIRFHLKEVGNQYCSKNSLNEKPSNLEMIKSHIDQHYVNIRNTSIHATNTLYQRQEMYDILKRLSANKSVISVASNDNSHQMANEIAQNEGDYLLEINQSNQYLFEQVKDQLDRHIHAIVKKEDWFLIRNGSSLCKRRFYMLKHQLKWIEGIEKWPKVEYMIAIENICHDEKETEQNISYKYYLSSLTAPTAKQIFCLTEFHFLKPYAWTISFDVHQVYNSHLVYPKIMKSNLKWIQTGDFQRKNTQV